MRPITVLRQALADLRARGLAIVDGAAAEDREMTEAENTEYDAITAEIETTKAELQRAEDLDERRRAMAPVPALQTQVHALNPETTHGFADIVEFARTVQSAVSVSRVGGIVDQRLVAGPAGTQGGGGTAGEGYMLPPEYADEVWELVNEFDEFGPMIDEEPTSKREFKMGADETTPWGAAGIVANWRGEMEQMQASQLRTDGRSVTVHELYALALVTEELLEDAPRLQARLTRKTAEAIAWKKNLSIVEGTGVSQPMGWMKSPALITIPKTSGQAAATFTAENAVTMYSRLKMIPGDRPFWLISQTVFPQLATMTIGDKPIWIPPTGLVDAPAGFLLGLPVRFSEFAEDLGTKGDVQLVSPRGYYFARRTSGLQAASSIHLYFDYNIQAFRWIFRGGGQPHLSKPIEPAKGSATRSHFVTLAART